jgi:hypothetical protein
MEMTSRAPVLAAAVCTLVLAVVIPARADAPTTSGSNEYSGRQGGTASTDTSSSHSSVIDSSGAVSDVSPSDDTADGGSAIIKSTLRHRSATRLRAPAADIGEERVVTITHPRFQHWSRGWSAASTAEVPRRHRQLRTPSAAPVTTAEVKPAPVQPSVTTALASADDPTVIRRQADGLTGPPGPLGPATAPDATAPIRVAPEVPAPAATLAPAPAPVPRTTAAPAPARRRLPLNGAETERMAKTALLLMATGFALMALARRVRIAKAV